MPWQHLRILRFGGPQALQLTEEATIPEPGPGEVRIKVLAAGTGFTDTMIRRGRYPDFKGPLPFTPGYEIVGVVEKLGPGVTAPAVGERVADLCVVGGYAQYAIRPARFLVQVPEGVDPAEAVCIPLAYLTAFQMLTRCRNLPLGATILVIGASGTVGTALLDLARHLGLKAIGTCSAANLPVVERFGAAAIDYRAGDFVASVRQLTAGRPGGPGVDIAFDAIGGAHFGRSFACLAPGGMLVGYGSQAMAVGGEGLFAAALGLARLKLWSALRLFLGGRRAVFYSITARRSTHPEEFKADMTALFKLLREGLIHPIVIDRLPLAAASEVHARIDSGGLGGKIVLLPWSCGTQHGVEVLPAKEAPGSDRVPVAAGPALILILSLYFDIFRIMKSTDAIESLAALAQESRLAIFRMLVKRGPEGYTPTQLGEKLNVSSPTLSFHLKELQRAGLVDVHRDGRFLFYHPNFTHMNQLIGFLTENCCVLADQGCDAQCAKSEIGATPHE